MPGEFPSSATIRQRIADLNDPNPRIRQQAIYHLARSVVHVDDVIAAVANALDDNDVDVCREAAVALFMFGAQARIVMPAIITALRHSDLIVRRAVAAAVGSIGPEAVGAAPTLRQLENDPDELLRVWVQEALKAIGTEITPDGAMKTELVAGT